MTGIGLALKCIGMTLILAGVYMLAVEAWTTASHPEFKGTYVKSRLWFSSLCLGTGLGLTIWGTL